VNKKYLAIVAVIVVAVIIGIVAFVFLSGIFNPPVDISGINIATTRTNNELLPSTVAGLQLGSNITEDELFTSDSNSFDVTHTTAQYGDLTVHIYKTQYSSDASDALTVLLSDESLYGGASSSVKTNDWFTANKGGRSVFFWKSGVWVFGIDAENDTIRNTVANDFVQYLRSL
jgi:hypothetical protein